MTSNTVSRSRYVLALFIALLTCAALCLVSPAQARAAQDNDAGLVAGQVSTQATYNYSLGKTITATLKSGDDQYYAFSIPSTGADVNISFSMLTGENTSDLYSTYDLTAYARLQTTSGSYVWSGSVSKPGAKDSESSLYLSPGSYQLRLYSNNVYAGGQYYFHNEKLQFCISKTAQRISLSKKSGKFTSGVSKSVTFKYSGTYDYAYNNVKVLKNTKPKVASAAASVSYGGTGTLTITPNKLGKTVVSLQIAGGNTVKFTVYVTNQGIYIAKGQKISIGKPIGVKKVNYKSKKKSVASVTKKGKVSGKKQGKAKVYTKSGKITYTTTVVVVDYSKLAKAAKNEVLDGVPDPSKAKFLKAYKGFYKGSYSNYLNIPVVWLDCSYSNESGGSSRVMCLFAYDGNFNLTSITGVKHTIITSKKKALSI